MNYTVTDKLRIVEMLIEERRWAHADSEKYQTALVLKAVAADMRARMPGAPGEAAQSLGRRIHNAKVAKNGGHYPAAHLIGIGQETIGRWPTIRQALEQFEAAVQEAAE